MKLFGVIAILIAVTASAQQPSWKLTPTGWGPARIGMNRAQLAKALHVELEGEAFDNEGSCIELYAGDNALPGMIFMLNNGKLTRITATEPSKVTTPRGIGVGATADDVPQGLWRGTQGRTSPL